MTEGEIKRCSTSFDRKLNKNSVSNSARTMIERPCSFIPVHAHTLIKKQRLRATGFEEQRRCGSRRRRKNPQIIDVHLKKVAEASAEDEVGGVLGG